jgi:hypothetical protein
MSEDSFSFLVKVLFKIQIGIHVTRMGEKLQNKR